MLRITFHQAIDLRPVGKACELWKAFPKKDKNFDTITQAEGGKLCYQDPDREGSKLWSAVPLERHNSIKDVHSVCGFLENFASLSRKVCDLCDNI